MQHFSCKRSYQVDLLPDTKLQFLTRTWITEIAGYETANCTLNQSIS